MQTVGAVRSEKLPEVDSQSLYSQLSATWPAGSGEQAERDSRPAFKQSDFAAPGSTPERPPETTSTKPNRSFGETRDACPALIMRGRVRQKAKRGKANLPSQSSHAAIEATAGLHVRVLHSIFIHRRTSRLPPPLYGLAKLRLTVCASRGRQPHTSHVPKIPKRRLARRKNRVNSSPSCTGVAQVYRAIGAGPDTLCRFHCPRPNYPRSLLGQP